MKITLDQEHLPSSVSLLGRALLTKGNQPLPELTVAIPGFVFERAAANRYNACCGFAQDSLPLPYLFVATQPAQLLLLTQPAVSLRLLGMIHTHVSFCQDTPLEIGVPYDFELSVGGCWQSDKGMEFELVGRFARNGAQQAEYRSRCLVKRAKPNPASEPKSHPKASEQAKPEDHDALSPPHWDELERFALTPKIARGYAAVSGDYNPIHLHWLTAKPFGFKAPIIHGMYSVARMVAAIDPRVRDIAFSFRRPAFLPAHTRLEGRQGELRLLNDEGKPLVEAQYRSPSHDSGADNS